MIISLLTTSSKGKKLLQAFFKYDHNSLINVYFVKTIYTIIFV